MVTTESRGSVTALTLYNLPQSITEDYVHSLFPSARNVNVLRGQADPSSSQGMCVLQFNSPYECQKVYAECRDGKEVAGRMLHAELGERHDYTAPRAPAGNSGGYGDRQYSGGGGQPEHQQPGSFRQNSRNESNNPNYNDRKGSDSGCSLTLSNLPYSASERDIWNEFPEALKVVLNLDERGRSRGVAQVSFSSKEQCNAAYESCNYKMMSGRPVRGRINRDDENGQGRQFDQRGDFGNRQGRYNDDQRSNRFNDEQRNYGGARQGRFGDEHRDYGGSRQGFQGAYNRDRDNYRGNRGGPGAGGNRGGYGGGGFRGRGGGGGGGNRYGNRDDSFGNRRDRSPGRDEPVRGYSSHKGGPRITSAVINRPGGHSPQSSSSSSEQD